MKSFTKQNLTTVRAKLNAKMAEFEKETGIRISLGNITFDSSEFKGKITAKLVGGKSEEELEKVEFQKTCNLFGFTLADYKKETTLQGRKFELIGFKPKATKNNAIMKCVSTGKQFVTNVSQFQK